MNTVATTGRILEITGYSLLNLLPYLLLAVLTFRENLRLGKVGSIILGAMLAIIQVGLGISAAIFFSSQVGVVTLLSYAIYIVFFVIAVRAPAGALLFTLFLVANYASLVATMSKCLEYVFFPANAFIKYCWSFSMFTVLVQATTLPFLSVFVNREIRPVLNAKGTRRQWRYLWTIPATFYLVWYYVTYFSAAELTPTEIAIKPLSSMYLVLINLGFIVVYYAVASMLKDNIEKLRLKDENHRLEMQNMQLRHLEDRMEEARRARHDLRQHVGAIRTLCDQNEFDEVKRYVDHLSESRSFNAALTYCLHPSVNALLVYYLDLAREAGATIECRVELDEAVAIASADLTVLFGNLLENAVEAVVRQTTGEKFLTVAAHANSVLILTLDNSYSGVIQPAGNGFLSSKRRETGIGIESVKSIAEKYGGLAEFQYGDGVFKSSVMLNPHARKAN